MPVYKVSDGEVSGSIHAHPDLISNTLKLGRFYETDLLQALKRHLECESLALDVGAHVGNHTVYMAHFGPVFSFEPVPSTYDLLLKSIQASDTKYEVKTVNAAVSDLDGCKYRANTSRPNSGAVTLELCPAGEIESVAIDSFNFDAVSVIKVDVEGMELPVLMGCVETLKRCKPVLSLEIKMKEQMVSIESFLNPLGYKRGSRYCASPTYLFHPT